ncbi:MAG: DUF2390 domain-containing protein [Oceanospirillaceae bacterium]|nr:DUF2390 domain-containing protein [Oceanospirillaceae bacterium]MCP5335261.1 DUF2390 domain-containing protein [Oceanospirillaceae bacterium]MCP5350423.1 DUF2390 domain-containing protein [Oceanospirillaceae bacterium]
MHDAIKPGQNPFWLYSVNVWQDAATREVLLQWQDVGADINVLLFCAYLTRQGRVLNLDLLGRAGIEHWQRSVVQPLREARMKLQAEKENPVYQQLKQQELDAEQHEQELLASLEADCEIHDTQDLLAINLHLYLGSALLNAEKEKAQQLMERLGCF